ncbi:MAG: sodium:solute symporter, partial [Candidatus Eremiobacteraeota bacterium]|nr:sodium:solute symporter [Candidatus Eremiobacteraeota bacterium]
GFLALLGFCALAAGIVVPNNNLAIPVLFNHFFPNWFAGVAFAAIVIGALVPAAIMAIGAGNLFASNILQSFSARRERASIETNMARFLSLAVLLGALIIALGSRAQYAIYFQLLGGAWILQIFPAVVLGLYTRWFRANALLAGWLVGMVAATRMAFSSEFKPVFTLNLLGHVTPGYIAFYALILNIAVAAAITLALRAVKATDGIDLTTAADYA